MCHFLISLTSEANNGHCSHSVNVEIKDTNFWSYGLLEVKCSVMSIYVALL
jgi:hypothetical protein